MARSSLAALGREAAEPLRIGMGHEGLVGTEWSVERLRRGSVVLVDEAAEDVTALDIENGAADESAGVGPVWLCQVEASVRTLPVVMGHVGAQDLLGVAAAEDQEVIEALIAHRAHPALGVGVGSRRPDRGGDDPRTR